MANQTASRREALKAQQAAAAKAARIRRMIGIGAGVVALALVAIFVVIAVNQGGSGAQVVPPNAATNAYGVQVKTNPDSVKDGIAVSPSTAKAGAPVVQLFADYQCPGCKAFDNTYGEKLNELATSGEISLSVQTMTFLDRLGAGKSTNPAIGAACADVSGVFMPYHLGVFARQPATEGDGYSTEQLRTEIPTEAGLSGEALAAFQRCFDSKATASFVSDQNKFNSAYTSYWYTQLGGQGSDEARAWGSTPLLTVNGKMVPSSSYPADANRLLDVISAAAG